MLEAVLAQAPFGFAVFDTELRYLHVNDVLAALNGRPAAEHRGLRLHDIAPELEGLVGPLLRNVLTTRTAISGMEFDVPSPVTSKTHHFVLNAYPVPSPDGGLLGVAAAVVDVSEQRRAHDQMEALARQQGAVVELGLEALRGASLQTLVTAALRSLRDVLDVDQAAVVRAEGNGRFGLYAVEPARPLESMDPVIPGDRSQAGQTLACGQPTVMPDRATETRFDSFIGGVGLDVRSSIAAVVPGVEGPFGVLGVYDEQPREISDDAVQFVQAVAAVIGTAVERRRTERELEASNSRLRMAQEAGRMGAWEWDLRLDRIIWSEALEHLYGLATGEFDGTYEMFKTFVHPEDAARTDALLDEVLLAGAYENEHRIVRADTGDVRWIHARGEVIRDDRGTAVRMVGINIDITERKAVEEARAAALEAEQAARADAEQARERLTFLAEATAALSVSLDYAETLQAVTRLAVPGIGDLCVVDLMENGQLSSVAVAHSDPAAEELVWELRRAHPDARDRSDPTKAVLHSGRTMVIESLTDEMLADMAVDETHLAKLRQLDIRSAVLVPLVARGRVLGLLGLGRHSGRPGFTSGDDAALLTEVGRRAALAIDNARLFAEVSRTGERFRRMAETLQASLLPPTLPSVPGADLAATYRPAAAGATVGGDFYDVFPRADGAWGVVIGDVQGKGTEAASLTALARHTLRTAAIRRDPVGALHILNEMLVSSEAHQDRFCTVLYGELRTSSEGLRVTFASGGHPPALLRRASSGTVELVGGAGSLMGVFDTPTVSTERVTMYPGDVLVLYTDGVTEARGDAGEFGEDGLVKLIASTHADSAQAYVAAVEAAVAAFTDGRLRDDLAVMAIRAALD